MGGPRPGDRLPALPAERDRPDHRHPNVTGEPADATYHDAAQGFDADLAAYQRWRLAGMAADVARSVVRKRRVVTGPPGIAPLALRQLAAWQAVAAGWTATMAEDHLRCAACEASILAVGDPRGIRYMITVADDPGRDRDAPARTSCGDGASRAIVAGETPGDMLLRGSHCPRGIHPRETS